MSEADSRVRESENNVQTYLHSTVGVEARISVVEFPRALYTLLQWHYEVANKRGKDTEFSDYITDVVVFEPESHADGVAIDDHTGKPVSESRKAGNSPCFSHFIQEDNE